MRATVPTTACRACGPKGNLRVISHAYRRAEMRFHYVECSRCRMRGPQGVNDRQARIVWDDLPQADSEAFQKHQARVTELEDRNRVLYGEVKALQRSNEILRKARKDDLAKIRELYDRLGLEESRP